MKICTIIIFVIATLLYNISFVNAFIITKVVEKTNQQIESDNLANSTNSTITNGANLQTFTNKTTITNSKNFLKDINLLNKMGYLPFRSDSINDQTNEAIWTWDYKYVPKKLSSLTPHSPNNILYRGAIKAFLNQSNLSLDNTSLHHLLKVVYDNGNFKTQKHFIWLLVNQVQPERLKAWQNGQWVFETNVNTGVDNLTPNGNFIVYSRYKKFTMNGIFPINDKPYYDKNVPYVNFFNGGEAIHGFIRSSYGFSQSAGCVELPIHNAKILYKMLYVGAVVTIERKVSKNTAEDSNVKL